ncbi:MAG TPA: FG-GAP repeat protein, partial [Myxococcota bacterium]|nr:FG-GAP repeat protein [Myxococcota bacterium]
GGCENPPAEEEDLCDNALLARVGAAVAVVDLDGNGRAELLVGAPGFRSEGKVEAGKLWVLKDNPALWAVGGIPLPSSSRSVDLDLAATTTRVGSAFQQVGAVLTTGRLGSEPAVGLVVRKRATD